MANEIVAYEQTGLELYGSAQAKRTKSMSGIKITAPGGGSCILKKNVDYGEVQGRDCIWKGGAEKIAIAYGMLQHYTVEVAEENFSKDEPFFFYRVRCDLVKVAQNGQEYVFSTGRGSSNSREKANMGVKVPISPFDVANKILKVASKRALSSAAVALGGLSDLLTVDLDDQEDYARASKQAETAPGEEKLTADQARTIFKAAENSGLSVEETQKRLKSAGYKSLNDIRQKDFETVYALFKV